MGRRTVHLRLADGQTAYKVEDHEAGVTTAEKFASDVMPRWIIEHSTGTKEYKGLSFPAGINAASLPLLVTLSVAVQPPTKSKQHELALPGPFPEVVWVAPIRTKPRRTYDELQSAFSAEGSHTPYLIKRILDSESEAKKFKEFMRRVGRASGLFQSIQIKPFGSDIAAPFEVDAVLDEKALNLSTVGYGVSQSLPIFVELVARPRGSVFAIQQPEVHLHPRAQAALGDVFFEMAVRDQKSFLIETHSDFTIDRFRMNYRRKKALKPNSQILFFERRHKRNTVCPLQIGSNGDLPSDQPDGYRRFFVKEEMRLLGL
jgi:hypothetical protein